MKKQNVMIMTLAIGLAASSLMAQDNEPPRHPRPGQGQTGEGPGHGRRMMPPPPLVGTLDANHDGTISADEIANAPAALKTLDKNNDGQLTAEELRPMPPKDGVDRKDGERRGPPDGARPDGERRGPPPGGARPDGDRKGPPPGDRGEGNFHPPVPPLIGALDANGDKIISADEIANASNALKSLDKNGDGQLTKEELRPEPPPRQNN